MFAGCNNPDETETTEIQRVTLDFVQTSEIAHYDILLSPDINFRDIVVPAVFNFGWPADSDVSLVAIKGTLNTKQIRVTISSTSFRAVNETEEQDNLFATVQAEQYLILNIFMRMELIDDSPLLEQNITSFVFIINGALRTIPVDIKIYDRRSFGVYRSINDVPQEDATTEFITVKKANLSFTFDTNAAVNVKSLSYPDVQLLNNFKAFSMKDSYTYDTELSVDSNLNINVDIKRGQSFKGEWDHPLLGYGYFGKEVIVTYLLRADNKEYIETYFAIRQYHHYVKSVIITS
jgi:hypothetical protein